jgi:1-acyl-sn-glycerol-3-phosphate acyltransferase
MSKIVCILKLVVFIFLIIINLIVTSLMYLFIRFNKNFYTVSTIYVTSIFASLFLKLFSIHVNLNIEDRKLFAKNYLIVSNHLSYIDILVISKFLPTCFITSQEIKSTPFLGWLCFLNGCLFVDRKNFRKLSLEIKEIAKVLKMGFNVAFFPEATSTNGVDVLEFKKPLFKAAIDSQCKILPLCLNYKSVNGNEIDVFNRDNVFWYGDTSFFPHFIRMLQCRSIEVELSILDEIDVAENKASLSVVSYEKVRESYIPILS